MALILLGAAGLRVGYVLTVTRHETGHLYDATYYELQARAVAAGEGFFDNPFTRILHPGHEPPPAADHPPLTALVLVPAGLIGNTADSRLAMRLTMTIFGLGVVVLVGLLGRELFGDAAGLVAAGLAAVDPNLWVNDGLIMSEALSTFLTIAIVFCAYRVLRGASGRWIAGMAVLCGLAVLVRAELALLTPAIALPAVWIGSRGSRVDTRRRVGLVAACGAGAVLVVMPWVGYNLARFEKPTFISTNDGFALLAGNCNRTYHGDLLAFTDIGCVPSPRGDQSVANAHNRSLAFAFIGDHLDRFPVVALARAARMWSVFRVDQTAGFNAGEGRPRWATYAATAMLYALVPFAVFGGWWLRRRKIAIWPLVAPLVIVTVSIALWTGGIPRYRAPAEPSIIVLAAVGVVALVGRARRESDPAPGRPIDRREPVTDYRSP